MTPDDLSALIRAIPNYPKPGIMFRDVTTLFADAEGFRRTVELLAEPYGDAEIDYVAAVDARGFILGGAVAVELGLGFVPIRKKGKLPADVISEDYTLEYGIDTLQMHTDAIPRGSSILLVDDLIATGGTAVAGVKLIERLGGRVAAASFVVDLPDLGGAQALRDRGIEIHTLLEYEGD